MKSRMAAGLLALTLTLGLSGCKQEPAKTPDGPAPAPTAAAIAPAPPARGDDQAVLDFLGVSRTEFLRAARRATAQSLDRRWQGWSGAAEDFYAGLSHWPSPAAVRAQMLARVGAEDGTLWLEEGRCLYEPSFWPDGPLELELDHTSPVSSVQSDGVVTATLEHDRVFLRFADTEEAAWYLTGGWTDDEGESPVCPVELGGPGYEVDGLWSNYADMRLVSFGNDYRPYLILVTDQGAVEMVDILACARAGVFCAMPIPGVWGAGPVELVEQTATDDWTVLAVAGDRSVDLSDWLVPMRRAVPVGVWSGAVDEIAVGGGSYAVMATFDVTADGGFTVSLSELDALTAQYDGAVTALGMTGEGLVCAYEFQDETGAWRAGTLAFWPEDPAWSDTPDGKTLRAKVLSGTPVAGRLGEELVFTAVDWG